MSKPHDPHFWDISGTVGVTDTCPRCGTEAVLDSDEPAANFNASWMCSAWMIQMECPDCGICWDLVATAMVHRTGEVRLASHSPLSYDAPGEDDEE